MAETGLVTVEQDNLVIDLSPAFSSDQVAHDGHAAARRASTPGGLTGSHRLAARVAALTLTGRTAKELAWLWRCAAARGAIRSDT